MSNPIEGLSFRQATVFDWPAVAHFASSGFADEARWQTWVQGGNGPLVVAVGAAEQVLGFGKLSELGPAEWWLESLHTTPEFDYLGVRQALLTHLVELFRRQGHGILRLTISSADRGLIDHARQLGFRHIGSYAPVEASHLTADYRNFKILQPNNLELAYNYLRHSPMYRVSKFVEHKGVLYFLSYERLVAYLADERVQVLGWRQLDRLQGLAILFLEPPPLLYGDPNPLYVGYLNASDDTTVLSMLVALRGLTARRRHDRLVWKMPLRVGLDHALDFAELRRTSDDETWLFELPIRL